MNDTSVIKLNKVSFGYGAIPVLIDVNTTIFRNEYIWIVGPNGGGKTTLIKLILGLLKPDEGNISIFGKRPEISRPQIGYMPQVVDLDPQFPVTVKDVVLMGRLGNSGLFGFFDRKDIRAAESALDTVDLLNLKNRPFSSLSGGQQRRLLIARALASEPEILILDEPTANLDVVVEKTIYKLLRDLSEKMTILMVSHNPTFVSEHVQRVLCVNRKVTEHPTSEMDSEMMGDLYAGRFRMIRHDRHIEERADND